MRRKANLGPARLSRIHYFENNRPNLSSHLEIVIRPPRAPWGPLDSGLDPDPESRDISAFFLKDV